MERLLWEIPGVEYVYSTSSPGSSLAIFSRIADRAVSVDMIMRHVVYALVPICVFAVYLFGLSAALLIYGLTLVLELFITSGSAKALLLIPILMPLADLVGVNRQIAVSAYCFGDGFSNMAYPTNAALLITLGMIVNLLRGMRRRRRA